MPEDPPTPLLAPGERPPPEIRPLRSHRGRGWRVLIRFLSLAAGLLRESIGGRLTGREAGRRVRRTLADLGGLWPKMGQILATSHGSFPLAFLVELMGLHHRSHAFDPAVARRIIEEDLERPIDHLFRSFDDTPLAAGSIGQVHRAVLRLGNKDVAVKIRRPDIEELHARDLGILRWVLRILVRRRNLRRDEMHRQIARVLEEERDYRREAENLRLLRERLADHGIDVPKPYLDHSSERVLTMEFVEGVALSDLLDLAQSDPDRAERWRQRNGFDAKKVARRVQRSILRQFLEEGLYHGEPAAANLIATGGNRVTLIDAGAVGRMDHDFQRKYERFIRAVVLREYRDATDRFIQFFEPIPPIDIDQLRKDALRIFRSWDSACRIRDLPYAVRSLGSLTSELARLCLDYEVLLEWYHARLDRTLLHLDTIIRYFDERVDAHRQLARYFREADRRRVRASLGTIDAVRVATTTLAPIDRQIDDLGQDVADIVRRSALSFESTAGKLTTILALVLERGRAMVHLSAIYLALVFVHQAIVPVSVDPTWSHVSSWIEAFPILSSVDWVVLSIGFLIAYRLFGQVLRRLLHKETAFRAFIG